MKPQQRGRGRPPARRARGQRRTIVWCQVQACETLWPNRHAVVDPEAVCYFTCTTLFGETVHLFACGPCAKWWEQRHPDHERTESAFRVA